jgi:hypothetical protein
VGILKHGQLARARVVAFQNQSAVRSAGDESYGVKNVHGPWLDFETGLAQAQRFRANTLPVAPPGLFNPITAIMTGFGCILLSFAAFAVVFFVVALTFVWIGGNQPVSEKAVQTLLGLTFLAAYLAVLWFIRRWLTRMKQFASGKLSMAQVGIPSIAHGRFVFSTPDGSKHEVTAYMDLRQRLETGQANPADLAVYLPDDPQRVILLGGLWPPIAIQDGEWVRGT